MEHEDPTRRTGSGDPMEGNPMVPSGSSTLNCDETVERLYFYLDGELTEERRGEIQRHLDLCAPCVSAFGFEAELRRVVANRCRDRVPDNLVERVAAAIRAEQSASPEGPGPAPAGP